MLRFLTRRVLGATVILIAISLITYVSFFAMVPNPALLSCGKNCSPQMLHQITVNLHFDQPWITQWWLYISGIFGRDIPPYGHCDFPCFGFSFANQEPIWSLMSSSIPTTISLAIGGAAIFLVIGVGLGMVSAWRQGSMTDKVSSGISLVGQSTQIYFVGPIAILIFSVWLGLVSRGHDPDWTHDPLGSIDGLILPCFVMSIIFWSNYTRQVRSLMIEQLSEDHIRSARAKGMSSRYVFFRYALRGAMGPILTIFGIDLAAVFSGAIITEATFSLHGLGMLAVTSVNAHDLPLEMAVVLVSSMLIVFFNIIVDASYALIDPRIRLA